MKILALLLGLALSAQAKVIPVNPPGPAVIVSSGSVNSQVNGAGGLTVKYGIKASSLTVTGPATVGSLAITGGGSFSGSITATSATLTGTGNSFYDLGLSSGMRFLTPGTGIRWADGSVSTAAATLSGVQAIIIPPGLIAPHGSEIVPLGWLECNGQAISRANFPDLFGAIGTSWGQGDGSTTFNVPDLRGDFIRGWNHGGAVGALAGDPDAAARLAYLAGGATGDNVGSYQDSTFTAHTHDFGALQYTPGYAGGGTGNIAATTTPTESAGGSETRGKNAAVMFIISTGKSVAAILPSDFYFHSITVDTMTILGAAEFTVPAVLTDTLTYRDIIHSTDNYYSVGALDSYGRSEIRWARGPWPVVKLGCGTGDGGCSNGIYQDIDSDGQVVYTPSRSRALGHYQSDEIRLTDDIDYYANAWYDVNRSTMWYGNPLQAPILFAAPASTFAAVGTSYPLGRELFRVAGEINVASMTLSAMNDGIHWADGSISTTATSGGSPSLLPLNNTWLGANTFNLPVIFSTNTALIISSGTTDMRPSTVTYEGYGTPFRFNSDLNALEYYSYGTGEWFLVSANALAQSCPVWGGSVAKVSGRCVYTFTSSDNLAPTFNVTASVLMVGGGGGGGGVGAAGGGRGGGGAGGLIYQNVGLLTGTFPIVIGAGGAGGASGGVGANGSNGSNTTGLGLTALGGGGGGIGGNAGGSGGGSAGAFAVGPGTPPQGNDGGNDVPGDQTAAGGGGGAGETGHSGNGPIGGAGGDGSQLIASGVLAYYGGGGGSGGYNGSAAGAGGAGGRGAGGVDAGGPGSDGTANTGGGGGGAGGPTAEVGGAGGSGIVIIAFPPW
jgi:microcystin-dependent protein